MYKYLIIETDQVAISHLEKVLEDFGNFKAIATVDNESLALDSVLKESPDLVIMNIDNLIEKPFQFVSQIDKYKKKLPVFIAISNSIAKAYQVIKSGFFDLLINPLSDVDIRKSVLTFQKIFPDKNKDMICLKSYNDFRYIKIDNIMYLKADNNTTDFYMNNGSEISGYKTLKTYENLLPLQFFRIHKSYIINKNYVSGIQFGKYSCTLMNHKQIPFTKTYLDNLKQMKENLSQCAY